ncbi:K+-transporting ATPase ATPase C chain [Rhodococcus sp. AG1013]|uniref:potassium-transporting ATPase subunit C n=1 Tax=Rhodococcus sp. AG1013 TaxID=2183996 RepID=UPI000E0BEACD|nr:potassium-transporting ATPase subunit C [Rhodococcus sp. AG1013]RDI23205.1 K+-transporting ATPase ATPase C chain [Rhodococcus sp. AG1013]
MRRAWLRQHVAALRALLVLTVITGVVYPVAVWGVAAVPWLRDRADGAIVTVDGTPVGSGRIGQSFTGSDGNPLRRYFQSRPSAAGTGFDTLASGASNLGPESIRDTPAHPDLLARGATPTDAGFVPSLLTAVCTRSRGVGQLEGVDGSRPFCTAGGVGAVLSVIEPRDADGNVPRPERVVSVNEPCSTDPAVPARTFLDSYEGAPVECARFGDRETYDAGRIVPVRGGAPARPAVPADAVTASGSGLDPDISTEYAELQVPRVAAARGVGADLIRAAVDAHTDGRGLGFLGEPTVNVLNLNLDLDRRFPMPR